jgi:hypothetical protein
MLQDFGPWLVSREKVIAPRGASGLINGRAYLKSLAGLQNANHIVVDVWGFSDGFDVFQKNMRFGSIASGAQFLGVVTQSENRHV